ncbi:hypothetical protein IWX62_001445 [Arthrobacter sp. CAN_A1]
MREFSSKVIRPGLLARKNPAVTMTAGLVALKDQRKRIGALLALV